MNRANYKGQYIWQHRQSMLTDWANFSPEDNDLLNSAFEKGDSDVFIEYDDVPVHVSLEEEMAQMGGSVHEIRKVANPNYNVNAPSPSTKRRDAMDFDPIGRVGIPKDTRDAGTNDNTNPNPVRWNFDFGNTPVPAPANGSGKQEIKPNFGDGVPYFENKKLEVPNFAQPAKPKSEPSLEQIHEKKTELKNYAKSFERRIREGKLSIQEKPKGQPLLYYAVKANDFAACAHLLRNGADINCLTRTGDPLLFVAATNDLFDGTDMLRYLLSRGANPMAKDSKGKTVMEVACNDLMRYWINCAIHDMAVTPDKMNRLKLLDAAWVPSLHLSVIGQDFAKEKVVSGIIHFKTGIDVAKKPLVMAFCGPSGHGKTVLAERIAEVADIPYLKIMCENFSTMYDMFGAPAPYQGSEKGSQLNNFLALHSGKPSVVILDEFEKTNFDVWNAFLNPFDRGEYLDRRAKEGKVVDCTKTIFIITTNAADPLITSFFNEDKRRLEPNNKEEVRKIAEDLVHKIRDRLSGYFSPPLVGRIKAIIPFVPFSQQYQILVGEQALVTTVQKYREGSTKIGFANLHVHPDVKLYFSIKYNPELGARSIIDAVEDFVGAQVTALWIENPSPDYYVGIQDNKVIVSRQPIHSNYQPVGIVKKEVKVIPEPTKEELDRDLDFEPADDY